MADVFRTVEIIFSAVDQTADAFRGISQNADSFTRSLSNVTEPLSRFGDLALKTEAAIGAIGIAFAAVSVNNFAVFQNSLTEMKRQLDDTSLSLDDIGQVAIDMSNTFGVSASSVVDGIGEFKKASFTIQESIDLQREALKLMVAGNVDAALATDILIKAIKGFGLSVSDVPRFSEALNNVADKFAVNVTNLAEGTAKLSPIASRMGFSFEQTIGILTPVIELFGSGTEAADAFKVGLQRLQDDAEPTQNALKQLGVSQFDANGVMRAGKDIFFDVANALKGVDENTRGVIISQLVGKEQAARLGEAFNKLNVIQDATAVALEKTGSVQREVNTQMESLTFKANQNATAWTNLTIAIGSKLKEGTAASAAGMFDLANALSAAVKAGSFDAIINEINAMGVGFGKFLEQVAKNLPEALKNVDFTQLVQSFKDIGLDIGDIFGDFDLSSAEGLQKAIQFIVDTFASLNNVVDGIIDAWTPVMQAFLQGVNIFNDLGPSAQQFVGVVLGMSQVFESLKGFVTGAVDVFGKLSGTFASISGTGVVGVFAGILAAISAPEIVGLTALFAGIGASISYLIGLYDDQAGAQNAVVESSTKLNGSQEEILKQLSDISTKTGVSVKSLYDLRTAVDDGRLVFDQASGTYIKAGEGIRDYDAEVKKAAEGQFNFAGTVTKIADAFNLNNEATKTSVQYFNSHEAAMRALMSANSDLVTQWITSSDGLYELHQTQKDATDSAGDLAKAQEEVKVKTDELTERQKIAIENTHELEMTLLELASNERIKNMEFNAEIKVADIQAQAEQVVAAFDSIGVAIEATQKAQAEIFDALVEGLSSDKIRGLDKQFLQDFAKKQQEQAQQALDNQTLLVRAQVDSLNARTEAIRNGTALININADNLAPELQAVLRSLLEHLQLEANAEGLELLLP